MDRLNWKTLMLLAILAVGGTLELIKRFPAERMVQAKWGTDTYKNDGTPYNVRGARRPRPMGRADARRVMPNAARPTMASMVTGQQIEDFIAAQAPAVATEFDHKEKGAEGSGKLSTDKKAKKKKKLVLGPDEEWEYFTDPETGKRYRRKKKKDVTQEQLPTETAQEDDQPAKKDDTVDGLLGEVLAKGSLQPSGKKAGGGGDAGLSLEEWQRRLLTRPDAAATREFIQQYAARAVTADTFYKIVDMMMEDARAEMRELGLVCLGATPSLMSFNMLAEITKSQDANSSSIRAKADQLLSKYEAMQYLSILAKVMRAPTAAYNTILATQKLEISAQRNLAVQPVATAPNATAPAAAGTVKTKASYYQPFVVILETLTRSQEPSVQTQAAKTLETLKGLLNPDMQPTQPAAVQASQ